jgi:hypothetical protein
LVPLWSKHALYAPHIIKTDGVLYVPALIFLEDGADFQEKIGLEEGPAGAVVGPGADEAGVVAVAEPVRDLFDGTARGFGLA